MTHADWFSGFRLNFEQQGKRARELLKAARSGDARALGRFRSLPPKLAEAQHLIAQDLRFQSWAELKHHTASMARERAAIGHAAPLDADLRTLHIRCGSDIRETLQSACFQGDFLEHSYPYLAVRVRADTLPGQEQLLDSATFERVVIWSEFDCYDQLVLLRLLAHFAAHRSPTRLELINVGAFPGAARFIGLGQLPPEALRMLWTTRRPVTPGQLSLGLHGWTAFTSEDPRQLAALARGGTPELPLLAPALQRHLRELPALENGLGFTQQMALSLLYARPASLNELFAKMTHELDPLPGQGDLQVHDRVLPMIQARPPLLVPQPGTDGEGRARPPWTDVLALTDAGRASLENRLDFLSLEPPARWVGGVEIAPDRPDWRWDEKRLDAVRR